MKLAEFIGKLKATADGDGTLLDRAVIYFGSGMSNGNAHDRNNPTAVVLGGANGRLKGNRHIAVENKEANGQPPARFRRSGERGSRADRSQHGAQLVETSLSGNSLS